MPLPDSILFILGMFVMAAVFATGWCMGKRHLCQEIGLTEDEYNKRRRGD